MPSVRKSTNSSRMKSVNFLEDNIMTGKHGRSYSPGSPSRSRSSSSGGISKTPKSPRRRLTPTSSPDLLLPSKSMSLNPKVPKSPSSLIPNETMNKNPVKSNLSLLTSTTPNNFDSKVSSNQEYNNTDKNNNIDNTNNTIDKNNINNSESNNPYNLPNDELAALTATNLNNLNKKIANDASNINYTINNKLCLQQNLDKNESNTNINNENKNNNVDTENLNRDTNNLNNSYESNNNYLPLNTIENKDNNRDDEIGIMKKKSQDKINSNNNLVDNNEDNIEDNNEDNINRKASEIKPMSEGFLYMNRLRPDYWRNKKKVLLDLIQKEPHEFGKQIMFLTKEDCNKKRHYFTGTRLQDSLNARQIQVIEWKVSNINNYQHKSKTLRNFHFDDNAQPINKVLYIFLYKKKVNNEYILKYYSVKNYAKYRIQIEKNQIMNICSKLGCKSIYFSVTKKTSVIQEKNATFETPIMTSLKSGIKISNSTEKGETDTETYSPNNTKYLFLEHNNHIRNLLKKEREKNESNNNIVNYDLIDYPNNYNLNNVNIDSSYADIYNFPDESSDTNTSSLDEEEEIDNMHWEAFHLKALNYEIPGVEGDFYRYCQNLQDLVRKRFDGMISHKITVTSKNHLDLSFWCSCQLEKYGVGVDFKSQSITVEETNLNVKFMPLYIMEHENNIEGMRQYFSNEGENIIDNDNPLHNLYNRLTPDDKVMSYTIIREIGRRLSLISGSDYYEKFEDKLKNTTYQELIGLWNQFQNATLFYDWLIENELIDVNIRVQLNNKLPWFLNLKESEVDN